MTTWKKECYERWAKSSQQVEDETKKIRIKGLRLTKSEKDTCFFLLNDYPEEYSLKEPQKLKDYIIRMRNDEKEWEQNEGKQIREFVKEWRRLERKYDCFQYEMYSGGKHYAQYYCYNVGICPEKEVTLWQKQ